MGKSITLTKIEVNNIQISKIPSGGYTSSVSYTVKNDSGSVSYEVQSSKLTSESEDTPKLSVCSDAVEMNFVNSITTLMEDREEIK